ncbi:hypothetical protein K2X33_15030 [bacterium]|nr:hypothetical protein [bacterium]
MRVWTVILLLVASGANAQEVAQRFGIADMLDGVQPSVVDEIRPEDRPLVSDEALDTPSRRSRPPERELSALPTVAPSNSPAPVGDINWRAIREQAMGPVIQPAQPVGFENAEPDVEPSDPRGKLLLSAKRKNAGPEEPVISTAAGFKPQPVAASIGFPGSPSSTEPYRHDPSFGRDNNEPAAASGHGQDYALPTTNR